MFFSLEDDCDCLTFGEACLTSVLDEFLLFETEAAFSLGAEFCLGDCTRLADLFGVTAGRLRETEFPLFVLADLIWAGALEEAGLVREEFTLLFSLVRVWFVPDCTFDPGRLFWITSLCWLFPDLI